MLLLPASLIPLVDAIGNFCNCKTGGLRGFQIEISLHAFAAKRGCGVRSTTAFELLAKGGKEVVIGRIYWGAVPDGVRDGNKGGGVVGD
jgi:hypothetical protein